jgi:1-acyl-sn-glycerol-3-phosphate acyltransferase
MKRLLALVFKAGGGILKAYFSWIRKYAKHRENYTIEERFKKVQQLVRFVILKMGIKYDVTNFDDIYSDDKKKFIVCNHQSMYDCLLFLMFAKRPLTFIAKKEVLKFPFVGKILYIIDGEFFDRQNLKAQVKNVLNASKLIEEQKYDVVIFPEGTRQKELEKGLLPFHAGSFKIPLRTKCDIVLTGIYGSWRCLNFFKFKKKKE